MAAKPESKDHAPAPEKESAAAAPAAKSGSKGWIGAIAALILAPVLSLVVAQYVMLPKLQKQLAAGLPAAAADPGSAAALAAVPAGSDAAKGPPGGNTYDFANVVVNLAGTMGTRYLKTSFTVAGNTPNFKNVFEANKARLTDVTLNVLSSLTLSDLEEPGSKNVLRDKLVAAYNQALGGRMVDQVYFSDFLIQ